MNPPRYGQAEPRVSFPPPIRSRTAALAAVPDPRFRDQLAEELWGANVRTREGAESKADTLLPLIAAEVEARVQAAANQRAAEELRAAAEELVKDGRPDLTTIDQVQAVNDAAGWLDARADALAAAAQPTDGRTGK